MSDNTYEIAYSDEIHVTLTAAAVLSDATKAEGLKSFTHTTTISLTELKHLNSSGWSEQVPTGRSGSGTLAGDVVKGGPVQAVIKTALDTLAPIYVSVIDNPTATSGQQKGTRYCFYIESSEKPREAGNVVTFSYPLKQHGPPVAITAT